MWLVPALIFSSLATACMNYKISSSLISTKIKSTDKSPKYDVLSLIFCTTDTNTEGRTPFHSEGFRAKITLPSSIHLSR